MATTRNGSPDETGPSRGRSGVFEAGGKKSCIGRSLDLGIGVFSSNTPYLCISFLQLARLLPMAKSYFSFENDILRNRSLFMILIERLGSDIPKKLTSMTIKYLLAGKYWYQSHVWWPVDYIIRYVLRPISAWVLHRYRKVALRPRSLVRPFARILPTVSKSQEIFHEYHSSLEILFALTKTCWLKGSVIISYNLF